MSLYKIGIAIFLFLLSKPSLGVDIHVSNDFNKGVPSKIILEYKNQKFEKGPTNSEGFMPLDDSCKRGYKFHVEPNSPDYYGSTKFCMPDSTKVTFKLTKRKYIKLLLSKAKALELEKLPGKAALVYSEVASRMDGTDIAIAKLARDKSTKLSVTKLNLIDSQVALHFDKNQNRTVITSEFSSALKEWQIDKGIDDSGQLDYKTLSIIASEDISSYLFKK